MTFIPEHTEGFRPVSLLAGAILPGLGHVVRGEKKRGVLIGTGVLSLFFGGIFIGGIDVVDSREDRVWFFGQALVGPVAFGVDHLHQNHFKVREARLVPGATGPTQSHVMRSARPDEGRADDGSPVPGGTPPNRKSVGKMNEMGTLFSTIAGMMNLIVLIDAAFPSRRRTPLPNA